MEPTLAAVDLPREEHPLGSRITLIAATAAEATVRTIITRHPAVIFADSTLREAADQMVREGVGRLPVVKRSDPCRIVGFLSRSDILAAHVSRLRASDEVVRILEMRRLTRAAS
jgi:CBS domain-containing protein